MKENSNIQLMKIEKSRQHKSNFWEYLRNLHIFIFTFNFRLKTQEKFQSTLGVLWVITFIILNTAIITINNYFSKPEFTSYFKQRASNFSIKSNQINFTQENFDFGFYLRNIDETLFGNNIFKVKSFTQ